MFERVKADVEIYNYWSPRPNIYRWKLGALLYVPYKGGPELGVILEDLLRQATILLKRSSGERWWHSMGISQVLVSVSTEQRGIPAFYPVSQLSPFTAYRWRVYLMDKTRHSLELYRVSYNDRQLLEYMTLVKDWRKAVN